MFRAIIYLVLTLLIITFIRMVIGILMKGLGDAIRQEPPRTRAGAPRSGPEMPGGGDLKRDPVCGTFVPAVSSISAKVRGEVFYYCSPACRDKHATA